MVPESPLSPVDNDQTHHRPVPVKSVGNFQLQQSIGKGSMGKVKLGVHHVTGEKIAVKIVPRANLQLFNQPGHVAGKTQQQIVKEKAREENREVRTIREAHIMMLLKHPNIVGLRDLIQQGPYFYILMDFVNGGQLLHYIVKRQRLSDRRTRLFSRQIISALDYLHRNSIVHRDLKIENIMIDKSGRQIKIIDFGLSNLFCPERQLTTYCGSLYFAAPELLKATPYRGPEVDIWSLGVVIYVMATGSVPFDDRSMAGLHDKIKKGIVDYPAHLSRDCRDLLSKIFITDPKKRIIMTDIVHHPWLNKESTLINNHMPLRKKLSLPLDPKVVQRVSTGFNLGTPEDIERRLKLIIQSPVYDDAMEHLHHIHTTPAGPIVYDGPQSVPSAYHPYLSLYHLAMEKLNCTEKDRVIIKHTSLSRQGSIESIDNSSARSSQGSLVEENEHRMLADVPISHTPVLTIPSSGLHSQPAAIASTNYLIRIQKWLRSSFSQHHLAPEAPPTPPTPPQLDVDYKHLEVDRERLLTPSPSADCNESFIEPGSKSLFRKLSQAILNRSSSKSLHKKSSNISSTHSEEEDTPPPVPPKDPDYEVARKSTVKAPPGMSVATVTSRQTAHTIDLNAWNKPRTLSVKQYPNSNTLSPPQPTPTLSRSSSLAGYAPRRRGSVSKITGKIGSWISRSASLNHHKHPSKDS